ncbi:MAG TPA: hypothetical protein VF519_09870 [Mycobacteriales bacterium]|jgi:hypothetical protein
MAPVAVRLVAGLLCVATCGAACGGDGGAPRAGGSGTPTAPATGPSGETPRAPLTGPTKAFAALGNPIAWAPDGSVVSVEEHGEGASPTPRCPSPQDRMVLRLHPPDGGPGRVVSEDPNVFEPVLTAVSPDGAHLAVLSYCAEEFLGSVSVVSLRSPRPSVRTLPLGEKVLYGNPFAPATLGWASAGELLVLRTTFTPDGGSTTSEAVLVDVRTMRERVVASGADLLGARALPGGRLLTLSGDGSAYRVEVVEPGGARRRVDTATRAEPAPDGSRYAAWTTEPVDGSAYDARLRFVPLGGGPTTYATLRGDLLAVQWSPASDRLIALTESNETGEAVTRRYVVGTDGTARELDVREDHGLVWSPDGTRVAYADGEGEITVLAV